MAVTSLWKISSNLSRVIDYIKDEEKTEGVLYASGINCSANNTYEEMILTKKSYSKEQGILGFHGYQSFKEDISPELAHEIGVKLAEEMWGDNYEVLVTTHIKDEDDKHIHNHFVVNSVSFKDGTKYRNTNANIAEFRRLNDEICELHGVSTLEEKPTKKLDFTKYKPDNYYIRTKDDIDLAVAKANSYEEFKMILRHMKYDITYRSGKLSVRHESYKRNIRIERYFGEKYSIENIKKRIPIEKEDSYKYLNEDYIKNYKSIKRQKKKYHGLIGLYRYYLFLLKVYPANIKKYHITYEMRKDISRMETLQERIVFLDRNKITTEKEFESFKADNLIKEELLKYRRRHYRYKYNTTKDKIYLSNIDKLEEELNIIKDNLKECREIEKDTQNIKVNIEEYERESDKNYEYIK